MKSLAERLHDPFITIQMEKSRRGVGYLDVIHAVITHFETGNEEGLKDLYAGLYYHHLINSPSAAHLGITVDLNMDWFAQLADRMYSGSILEGDLFPQRSSEYEGEITRFCRKTLGYDTTPLDMLTTKHF